MKFIAGILLLAASLLAQDATTPRQPRSINTTGEATVTARPDQVEIDIGVVTQAQTAQEAGTANAKQLDATLAELKRLLGPAATIRTSNYSLAPNYKYPREGGRPTIAGYTATNVVEVKTGDLASVGKVIDAATGSGANLIQRLQFTLKDETAIRAEALSQAALKARASANAIASALGVKILGILRAEESSAPPIRPMMAMAKMDRMEAATPQTPVEPGTIDVRATVTLVVEISQ